MSHGTKSWTKSQFESRKGRRGDTYGKDDEGGGLVELGEVSKIANRAVEQLVQPQADCDDHEEERELKWTVERGVRERRIDKQTWMVIESVIIILYSLLTLRSAPTRLNVCHPYNYQSKRTMRCPPRQLRRTYDAP